MIGQGIKRRKPNHHRVCEILIMNTARVDLVMTNPKRKEAPPIARRGLFLE